MLNSHISAIYLQKYKKYSEMWFYEWILFAELTWFNLILNLEVASVALSWVSISNGLWWYCTILTPTELCLFFSSMHWMIKSGFADFDVGALSKFSTYYIPLPQQLASFAWYFHVVEGISQSQTLEYRFGRYLPVFFAHVHKMLQSCLTANQIYSR